MAAASQTIGKVFIVYGTVKAVTPSGLERVLAPNSPIHAGERIVTGPDGMVAITFTGGGQLDLGRMSDVLIDEDVYAGAGSDGPADTVAQVDEIQSALEDGDSDPTTDLPPPAAGPGVAGGPRGGGRQIVVFEPDQMAVTPDSGAETVGITWDFLSPPGGLVSEEVVELEPEPQGPAFTPPRPPRPPQPPDEPPDNTLSLGSAERTVDEANLADGSSPQLALLTTTGTLADLRVNFGLYTPGTLDFGNGQTILINGDASQSITLQGVYGTLTVYGTGNWSYTLADNTLDHTGLNLTGPGDQVEDLFPFAIIDANQTRVEGGSVLIHVLDDGPSLAVGNQQVDETGGLDVVQGTLQFTIGADKPGSLTLSADGAVWDPTAQTLAAQDGSWQLVVNPNGTYTFTQLQAMQHPDSSDPNDSLPIKVTATVVDGDKDAVTKDFVITVYDDGPALTVGNQQVDETGGFDTVQGTLEFAYGQDGPGSLSLSAEGAVWTAATQTLAAQDGSWQLVVNPNGTYTFTQLQAMQHPDSTDPNDSLPIKVTATVTDGDKDAVAKDFVITVYDDGPALTVGNQQVDETGGLDVVQGTLDFAYGQDGAGSLALSAAGADWNPATQTLAAQDGSWQLVVNPNGTYTFTQLQAMQHPDGTDPNDSLPIKVTATVTDGDNDAVAKDFVITVYDDGPALTVGDQQVDETGGFDTVEGSLDFAFGQDGAGILSLSAEGAVWTAATQTLAAQDGTWQLVVNPNGTYTFTQLQAMQHPDSTNPNDSLPIKVTATVTDADQDAVSQEFTVTVYDDGPTAGPLVQDAILANVPGNAVTGNLDIAYGTDGPAQNVAALQLLDKDGQPLEGQQVLGNDGSPLTSNGNSLEYVSDGSGGVQAVVAGTSDVVFTVSVDPATGTYTVELGSAPLDAPTETKLFSGPGGDQLNTSATFQVTPDLFVVATAAVTTTPPGTGYVQWDADGMGVYSPVTADQNIGPLEELRLTFQDADGDTQPLKSASFTLVDLGLIPTRPGAPPQAEVAVYATYLNGSPVGGGTVLGDADGTVTLDITSPTSFDTVVLTTSSEIKTTQYQVRSVTVDLDVPLTYTVLVTDGDGDTTMTGFDLTFDADGNITGTDASEVIVGTDGIDIIDGGGGADEIYGLAGNDVLDGGDGDDTIAGGPGADHLTGGAGTDTLSYAGDSTGVVVDLADPTPSGGDATGDVISGFENVTGGSGADTLTGDTGDNTLLGGGGADTIVGGSGDDTIAGGPGADQLSGGAGTDTLSYAGDSTGVVVDLDANTASGGDAAGDVISGFENVTGGAGDDQLTGDAGDNVLVGGAGDDTLVGDAGNDTLFGGSGSDTLEGGADDDILVGGADNQTATGTGDVLDGGAGEDTLFAGDETDGDAVDTVTGGDGDDTFVDGAEDNVTDFGDDSGDLDSMVPQPTEPG